MEAFGNARTVINDNSSRFGKYLDIKFGFFGEVLGASLADYLLESSRVCIQNEGERNFHVFYYLFAGLTDSEKQAYFLEDITNYHYIRGGVSGLTREAVIDMNVGDSKEMYSSLTLCMSDVGFSPKERDNIFKLLAVILHIGNLEFAEISTGYAEVVSTKELERTSTLMGVDVADMKFALEATTTTTRGESLQFNYNVEQAVDNRDSIAKAMYGRLFGWLVSKANSLLAPSNSALYEEAKGREGGVSEMGILDIFGFENFPNNSFEQLCINLANEQLQFYFNQHIFAWELASYQEEGIESDRITYKDNQPLLDMFLGKPLGLFALLDEESRFPRATPASYLDKVETAKVKAGWEFCRRLDPRVVRQSASSTSVRLKPDRIQSGKGSIIDTQGPFLQIDHFAGPVTYNLDSFLEKNKDAQSKAVQSLLKRSSDKLIAELFKRSMGRTGTISSQSTRQSNRRGTTSKLSTSAVFKNSLLDLMQKMLSAKPHFVRCIKPNTTKTPGAFSDDHVNKQLLYAGVIETTRIRRDGYSMRMTFEDFIKTYHSIGLACHEVPDMNDPENPPDVQTLRVACKRIVKAAKLRGAQLGISLIFLKYYHNESLRTIQEKMNACATSISKNVRRVLAKKELQRRKDAKLREIAEEKARIERERKAAERKRLEEEAAVRAKEEAEKAAALQVKLDEEEKQRRASDAHMATMKKRRDNEAKLALQKAQEAAEAAKETQLRLQEEAKKEEEEEARRLKEVEESRQEEEHQAVAEREANRKREQEALAAQRKEAAAGGSDENLEMEAESGSDDDDEFADLLNDEDVDVDARRHLKELQQQRQAEEVKRKRELKKQYEEDEVRRRHERLAELERLAEIQRKEDEEKEKQAVIDRAGVEERMAEMSFSFGWGAPNPWGAADTEPKKQASVKKPPPAVPKSKPASVRAKPASVRAKPAVPTSKPASVRAKPASAKESVADVVKSSEKDNIDVNDPKRCASLPPGPAGGARTMSVKGKPPPPQPPSRPSTAGSVGASDELSLRRKLSKAAPPQPPSAPSVSRVASIRAAGGFDKNSPLSKSGKKKKAPPPIPNQGSTSTPSPNAAQTTTTGATTTPTAPGKPATPAAAAPKPGEPRRRKLVRGANKKETPVLKEFTEAIEALQSLELFLDLYEAHDTELASASKQQNFSGNIRRRSTIMSSGRRKSKAESMKPATEKEVVALSNLLLIGEKSSNGDPQMDKPVSHEVRKRFMASGGFGHGVGVCGVRRAACGVRRAACVA